MTTGEIELAYATTTKDWTRVQALLDRLALRRESMLLYILSHKALPFALEIPMSGACIFIVYIILPKLLAKDVSSILSINTIFILVLVGFALWILGQTLWKLVAKSSDAEQSSRTGREGIHWGKHHLRATTESLSIRLSACQSVYSWNAISGLSKTKDFLLLQLTPRCAIAVPRRAFRSKTDETNFCEFVKRRTSS